MGFLYSFPFLEMSNTMVCPHMGQKLNGHVSGISPLQNEQIMSFLISGWYLSYSNRLEKWSDRHSDQRFQYSSGNSIVVTDLSPSVMM